MTTTAPQPSTSASTGTGDADQTKSNHTWEFHSSSQAWEGVQEDADGNIISSAAHRDPIHAIRRRRRLRARHDAAAGRRVVRDMIRYVYVVIDLSACMNEKDALLSHSQSRIACTVSVVQTFIAEYFDQNPISHLGIVLVKDGVADMLTQLSGNPNLHIQALEKGINEAAVSGQFSLQNGLELAGRSLGHMPRHGSREVVVIVGSLSTCDPGDVLSETLSKLNRANVRVSCIALTAEMYVCRKITEECQGTMGVALDSNHFKELMLAQCIPPPCMMNDDAEKVEMTKTCDFVHMGFPTRESSDIPSMIHSSSGRELTFGRTSYLCPRCKAKQSELPTDCAVCGLKLVLAPHLARSFHHLFPVPAFQEILTPPQLQPDEGDNMLVVSSSDCDAVCFACFRGVHVRGAKGGEKLRFQCPDCQNVFCAECDAYLHETLHNCPGCLCNTIR